MTERSITHSTFVIEREYAATPARAFAAFAEKKQKAKWFAAPGHTGEVTWDFDFREGGREYNSGKWEGGTLVTITENGAYLDGLDSAQSREDGTVGLLDALGASLD